jgi:hypothetical protein
LRPIRCDSCAIARRPARPLVENAHVVHPMRKLGEQSRVGTQSAGDRPIVRRKESRHPRRPKPLSLPAGGGDF